MLYHAYEMTRAALPRSFNRPVRPSQHQKPHRPDGGNMSSIAHSCRPGNPSGRDPTLPQPEFGLSSTLVDGIETPVVEEVVWAKPFCRLLQFRRMLPASRVGDPKVLIVAPMSGHYSTLLRGTVEAMLPEHDVFITDWMDARNIPFSAGRFDLDDYTDYLIQMLEFIRTDLRVSDCAATDSPGMGPGCVFRASGPDGPRSSPSASLASR